LFKLTDEQKLNIKTILNSEEFKSNLYEGLYKEDRKNLGQFYTPADVCIQMLEKFECESLSGLKILDPTCGSGNLLIACLIAGADSDKIFGNEYDFKIIPVCRYRINRVCDILGKPHIQDWQIHQGNALNEFALNYFGKDYDKKNVFSRAKKYKLLDI